SSGSRFKPLPGSIVTSSLRLRGIKVAPWPSVYASHTKDRIGSEAKVVIEQWRRHYNAIRPHSSLAYLTPDEFKQRYCLTEVTEAIPQD
ncbi:transposase, partial [Burkholderia anthina]|uniref:transposase n=1 Tax=Burkholderia anthina TaxID=179879 RepID=UPI001FC7D598